MKIDKFDVKKTDIPGLLILTPTAYREEGRGTLRESFRQSFFDHLFIQGHIDKEFQIKQTNDLENAPGSLRGWHAEKGTRKFIRCISGEMEVAFADLRKGKTFAKVHRMKLLPGTSVFIPEGVANSLLTTSEETASYVYYFDTEWWADPEHVLIHPLSEGFSSPWVLRDGMFIGDKDANHPCLLERFPDLCEEYGITGTKTLVLGSRGYIAGSIASILKKMGMFVVTTNADQKFTSREELETVLELIYPDVVINGIHTGNPGGIEEMKPSSPEWAACVLANVLLPGWLAQRAVEMKYVVYHLSTMAHLDDCGGGQPWHTENNYRFAQGSRLSRYAGLKLAAEMQLVTDAIRYPDIVDKATALRIHLGISSLGDSPQCVQEWMENVVVLRIHLLFSSANSPRNMLLRMRKFPVFTTDEVSMTAVEDLGRLVFHMIHQNVRGLFHCVNSGTISAYAIAEMLVVAKQREGGFSSTNLAELNAKRGTPEVPNGAYQTRIVANSFRLREYGLDSFMPPVSESLERAIIALPEVQK